MANLDFLYRNCDEYILLSKELDVILNTPKLSKKAFNTIIDDNNFICTIRCLTIYKLH